MTAWPASLPQIPLRDGYGEAAAETAVRFEPEVGPPMARRRGTARATDLSLAFAMTSAQLATFEAFYRDDLRDGALTYTWTHPRTAAAGTYMIVDAYEVRPLGGAWRVSFRAMELA